MQRTINPTLALASLFVTVSISSVPPLRAAADDDKSDGYRVSEQQNVPADPKKDGAQPPASNRSVRLAYLSGAVSVRADEHAAWKHADTGSRIVEGSQIWVSGNGRAELRFDDGSAVRLGRDAIVTIAALYTDDQGPYARLKLSAGLATVRVKYTRSVYEIDTPLVTVSANGPTRVRIGSGDDTEIGVRLGHATVTGKQGRTAIEAGGFLAIEDSARPVSVRKLPAEDSWERWNDERDRAEYGAAPDGNIETHRPAYPVYSPPPVWIDLNVPIGGRHERYRRYRRW